MVTDVGGERHFELGFEYKFHDRYNWDNGKAVTIAGITRHRNPRRATPAVRRPGVMLTRVLSLLGLCIATAACNTDADNRSESVKAAESHAECLHTDDDRADGDE